MIGRIKPQIPPSSFASLTPDPSPQISPTFSDFGADNESMMSAEEYGPSRPISMNIPQGILSPNRPLLSDVLANAAPPPYTLSAFTAFLSQNHCLETLEFTMEAKRYRENYDDLSLNMAGMPLTTDSHEGQELQEQWKRLLEIYVLPGAAREINLPSEVRDDLVEYPHAVKPPPPETLEPAVKRMYELMDESIFMPFINSFTTFTPSHSYGSPYPDFDEDMRVSHAAVDDRRSFDRRRSRRRRSPPTSVVEVVSPRSPPLPHSQRHSASNLIAPITAPIISAGSVQSLGRSGSRLSNQTSQPSSASIEYALTDDSGSASSPGREPMTPPTTPPSSDVMLGVPSPKSRSDSGTWRKMGMKLGWSRKKSTNALGEGRFPATAEEE